MCMQNCGQKIENRLFLCGRIPIPGRVFYALYGNNLKPAYTYLYPMAMTQE